MLVLLTPLEVLVPALALAFGYRAVLADARRGELEMLLTYPLSRAELVGGVYLGRAVAVVVAVLAPLALVGVLVAALGGPGSSVMAAHEGADAGVLFVRFVVLALGFALVILALAVAISAAARSGRSALAMAVATLLVLAVGLDLGLVLGLGEGVVGEGALQWWLAASPASAFRGLVLPTATGPAAETGGVAVAAPLASAVGLALWLVGGLLVATLALRRRAGA